MADDIYQRDIMEKRYADRAGSKERIVDKKIQDAHEAIRPTDHSPDSWQQLKDSLIQRPVPSVSADL